ncbi:MAG TPA: ABC transporter ATP-binding protein [Gammaproteobacteria bacterium]|nr:ABC transporter ATP-binding protein [Gammaproteobacteria bacterium]
MNALTIEKLQKIYSNGVEALCAVDLRVEEGDFFALLGQNGAGKSTLIGVVSSLVNKTSGKVKVFNHDIDNNAIAAKSCMGLVPQELNFYPFETVLNILVYQAGYYGLPRKIALDRAEKYLHLLGLWHKRNEISRNLSGGMKRRMMIARALMHQPRMLILDEPTAGIDIELRRATYDFLLELNRNGTTILLTTHYLEEAELLCRNVAIIDKGVILEHTSMKSLLKQLPHEHVVLDLQSAATVENLPQLEHVKLELIDSLTLDVTFDKKMTLNSVFDALSQHGINARSMRNKTNRLEELFLTRISQHAQAR